MHKLRGPDDIAWTVQGIHRGPRLTFTVALPVPRQFLTAMFSPQRILCVVRVPGFGWLSAAVGALLV